MVITDINRIPQILANFDKFLQASVDEVADVTKTRIRSDLQLGVHSSEWEPLEEFTEGERKAWGTSTRPPLYRTGEMARSINHNTEIDSHGRAVVVFDLPNTGDKKKNFFGRYLHEGPISVRGLAAEYGYGPNAMTGAQKMWFTSRIDDLVRARHISRPTGTVNPNFIGEPARPWFKPGQINAFDDCVDAVMDLLVRLLSSGRV